MPNDLPYTIALAKDAKRLGFKFLLDIHNSDTWADPGKQGKPKAWETQSGAELLRSVSGYTRDTIAALRVAGVLPDMVQIGNEIIAGMLWPDGKLPENSASFTQLIKAGIAGMDAGRGVGFRPRVMIHIDRGGDMEGTKYFFDLIRAAGVSYDVIGQSFCPGQHGSVEDLRRNLAFMWERYQKDIIALLPFLLGRVPRENRLRDRRQDDRPVEVSRPDQRMGR